MINPIAIIGSGIAGLACARRLTEAGRAVIVFDKGRKAGGRLATRRVETALGQTRFDHGAQFFTARDADFRAALAGWRAAGAVAEWRADFTRLEAGKPARLANESRFVGAPGMSALAGALADGLDCRQGVEIIRVRTSPEGHWLGAKTGEEIGPFSAVIIATPAEQAAPLLAPIAPAIAAQAAAARTAPCWAGLFAFPAATSIPFDAVRLADHPVMGWIGLDSAKPGRDENIVAWVVHARPDWTRANLERAADSVAADLLEALHGLFDNRPAPIVAQAHRWRYAQVEQATGSAFAWDGDARIGACGDWRLGARVELAWRSGFELAGALLG